MSRKNMWRENSPGGAESAVALDEEVKNDMITFLFSYLTYGEWCGPMATPER